MSVTRSLHVTDVWARSANASGEFLCRPLDQQTKRVPVDLFRPAFLHPNAVVFDLRSRNTRQPTNRAFAASINDLPRNDRHSLLQIKEDEIGDRPPHVFLVPHCDIEIKRGEDVLQFRNLSTTPSLQIHEQSEDGPCNRRSQEKAALRLVRKLDLVPTRTRQVTEVMQPVEFSIVFEPLCLIVDRRNANARTPSFCPFKPNLTFQHVQPHS